MGSNDPKNKDLVEADWITKGVTQKEKPADERFSGFEIGDVVHRYYETKDDAPWTNAMSKDDRVLQKVTRDGPCWNCQSSGKVTKHCTQPHRLAVGNAASFIYCDAHRCKNPRYPECRNDKYCNEKYCKQS